MKTYVLISVLLFVSLTTFAQKRDTFRVYFSLNDATLDTVATKFIDSLAGKKIIGRGKKFTVLGYADYLGSNGYNDTLSLQRARNVADYMVSKGMNDSDLELCTGKGKIDRKHGKGVHGYAADRHVQIIQGWVSDSAVNYDSTFAINVATIPVNSTFPLNILFENARSVMLRESNSELRRLYNFLKQNPTLRVRLEGHTCCMDPRERMQDGVDMDNGGPLSTNRAKVICDYLIKNGIDRKRLSYVGLANTQPWITPELTEEDKKQNRRVEVRIISK